MKQIILDYSVLLIGMATFTFILYRTFRKHRINRTDNLEMLFRYQLFEKYKRGPQGDFVGQRLND